jgi:hypothetical protein
MKRPRFFLKKAAKTVADLSKLPAPNAFMSKIFLVLFFKKEQLPCLTP